MDLKEVFTKLTTMEGGADLESAIKAEFSKLRSESATARTEATALKGKYSQMLKTLELEDTEGSMEEVKALKMAVDSLAKTGKKPNEVPDYLQSLVKKIEETSKQVENMTKTAETEKTKRLEVLKTNKVLSALTANKAVSPEELAKILLGNVHVKEDGETVYYKDGDKELSVDEGTVNWLKANPWGIGASANAGSGATPPAGNNETDPFLQGFGTK